MSNNSGWNKAAAEAAAIGDEGGKEFRLVITDSGLGGLAVCAMLEKALQDSGRVLGASLQSSSSSSSSSSSPPPPPPDPQSSSPDSAADPDDAAATIRPVPPARPHDSIRAGEVAGIRLIYVNAWPDERFGYNDLPDAAERARVFDRALKSLERLRPDMILIACNTLSVLYRLTDFSRRAAVPVRGIIDAGTDLFAGALAADPGSSIVIFGTKTTIESDIHRLRLIERGVAPERVAAVSCHGLAAAIDDDPGGEEAKRRLAACADDACRSTMKESPWWENPLRIFPFRRSLRFLPPFLARRLNPVLRPRGHTPLVSSTTGFPRHTAGHALRSSKSVQTLYAGLACTHYGWVAEAFREELEKRSGRRVVVLDPNERLAAATAAELKAMIAPRSGAPRLSSASGAGSGTAETRPFIAVEVVSKVALGERKLRAAAARIEPVSRLTASALLNYKHLPELF